MENTPSIDKLSFQKTVYLFLVLSWEAGLDNGGEVVDQEDVAEARAAETLRQLDQHVERRVPQPVHIMLQLAILSKAYISSGTAPC